MIKYTSNSYNNSFSKVFASTKITKWVVGKQNVHLYIIKKNKRKRTFDERKQNKKQQIRQRINPPPKKKNCIHF